MTNENIGWIAIGISIGFIISMIIYVILKSLEYKPKQRLSDIRFNHIPPPPPKPVECPKYKGEEPAKILKSIVEKGKLHDAIVMKPLDESSCLNQKKPLPLPESEITFEYDNISALIKEVVSRMNFDLKIASRYNSSERIRIAIPEPLMTCLKREVHESLGKNIGKEKDANINFNGIRIVENYQYNIVVYYVDWYMYAEHRYVQVFDIKRK